MQISRRTLLLASMLSPLMSAMPCVLMAKPEKWVNWSGALSSNPKQRLAPKSEADLAALMPTLKGNIRPVGAGHSFSPLVPTDGTMMVLDNLSGLIEFDSERRTAVLAAGTRLSDAGPLLDGIGQAMFNLPDIDRQTLAGAVSTSTHGTGLGLQSLSGYVTSLRLVTPTGDVLDLNRDSDPDRFLAARVSLGAMGILSRIEFQNREPFKLRTKSWVEPTDDVLSSFDVRCEQYQHYEFLPFPHADYSLVIAHEETSAEELAPPPQEDSGDLFALLNKIPISLRTPVFNYLLKDIPTTESVEPSFRALTNIRNDRFNEMEYSVPIESGLACVREVLETIRRESLSVVFPLEYRVIEEDDSWLSMFNGGPRASISIHRSAGLDFKPYFDRIEPIFWKYGGRPHWGKVHSMAAAQLREVYPRLNEFVRVQKDLDPKGQMLNAHLARVLGIRRLVP
jgi:FAD-linked oxidoreductase